MRGFFYPFSPLPGLLDAHQRCPRPMTTLSTWSICHAP
jgi:hypothetical protein